MKTLNFLFVIFFLRYIHALTSSELKNVMNPIIENLTEEISAQLKLEIDHLENQIIDNFSELGDKIDDVENSK